MLRTRGGYERGEGGSVWATGTRLGGGSVTRGLVRARTRGLRRLRGLSTRRVLRIGLLRVPLARLRRDVGTRLSSGPTLRDRGPSSVLDRDCSKSSPLRRNTSDDGDSDSASSSSTCRTRSRGRREGSRLSRTLRDVKRSSRVPSCDSSGCNGRSATRCRRVMCKSAASFCSGLGRRVSVRGLASGRGRIVRCLVNSLSSSNLLHGSLSDVDSRLVVCRGVSMARGRVRRILRILRDFSPTNMNKEDLRRYLLLRMGQVPGNMLHGAVRRMFASCFSRFAGGR